MSQRQQRMSIERRGGKVLRGVGPNAGIAASYRKRLLALIDEMARSTAYWLRAAYRRDTPVLAQDATPAAELQAAIERMARRWNKRFDDAAPELARWFAKSVAVRSQRDLMAILKRAGITVDFKMTKEMRDVFRATVEENVSLIKSIPEQFQTDVTGLVMRSVARGRDLGSLTKDLQKRYAITRRRAELIARDQNNKATSQLMAVRQTTLGIEEGIWMHSTAGKEPRRTHVANSGKRFSIKDGWFDPDPKVRKRILPGELINCRCTWKPVVKGFS